MADEQQIPPGPEGRWQVSIDLRDVLGGTGAIIALAGAAAVHWGAALLLLGGGIVAVAYRAARRR